MRCCGGPLSGYGIEMNDRYIDGIEQCFGFSFPPFLSIQGLLKDILHLYNSLYSILHVFCK